MPRIARLVASLVVLGAGLTACSDSPATTGKAGPAEPSVEAPAPGVTLVSSDGSGLAFEGIVLVRDTADIVELRADLVNRGTGALAVGNVQEALVSAAGPGAAALVTEDGGKRFYPLVRVDAGQVGEPQEVPSLGPGARIPIVIRFGPVAVDVARLRPVVPGFAASAPLHIAEK